MELLKVKIMNQLSEDTIKSCNSLPVRFPVYFKHKDICIHCGAEDCITLIDIFGNNINTFNMYTVVYAVCNRCHRMYKLKWEPNENGEYEASVTDNSVALQYKDFIERLNKEIKDSK